MAEIHLIRNSNSTIVIRNAVSWKILSEDKTTLKTKTIEVERKGMGALTFNNVLQVIDDVRERRHDKKHNHQQAKSKKKHRGGNSYKPVGSKSKQQIFEEKILALFD